VTSEDSYDLESLSRLLTTDCNLTVKEEKIKSLSNVKDGGLMVGIAIVGLVLTAIEPFISVLTYWQSQNPKYSATMVIDNITYTIENISPQKIKQIQSTLAGLQSNPKKSDTINGAHQDIWIAKNKSVLQENLNDSSKFSNIIQYNDCFKNTTHPQEDLRLLYERTASSRYPCIEAEIEELDWDLIIKYAKSVDPDKLWEKTEQETSNSQTH
jgi:hypothetical protein